MIAARFDPAALAFEIGGIRLGELAPLVDGAVPPCGAPELEADGSVRRVAWRLAGGERFELEIAGEGEILIDCTLRGFAGERRPEALGLRFGRVGNLRRYLRNGYTSWDGSYFVEPLSARAVAAADAAILSGHAATALVSWQGDAAVLGFLRHDRFQSRLRFGLDGPVALDVETLLDRVPCVGVVRAERLVLFGDAEVEAGLRRWARQVAAAAPVPPRLGARRLTGWCSWYGLYASLDEAVIAEHLAAARAFRDESGAPLDIFLIDDGFTPEMGDWLETKPQFPRGMEPRAIADHEGRDPEPGCETLVPRCIEHRFDAVGELRLEVEPVAHLRREAVIDEKDLERRLRRVAEARRCIEMLKQYRLAQ